jgi:hypothetical protein
VVRQCIPCIFVLLVNVLQTCDNPQGRIHICDRTQMHYRIQLAFHIGRSSFSEVLINIEYMCVYEYLHLYFISQKKKFNLYIKSNQLPAAPACGLLRCFWPTCSSSQSVFLAWLRTLGVSKCCLRLRGSDVL